MDEGGSEGGHYSAGMNPYSIQQKIATLAQLWPEPFARADDGPFDHGAFRFSPWNFTIAQGPVGRAWVAAGTVAAPTAIEALNGFRRELIPIVDRVAIASQCHATVEVESFLVHRLNENPDQVFLVRSTREHDGVPLHFGADERATLDALGQYPRKGDVFRYLREAINSTTFYTRLAMLMAALEAAAGQTIDKSGRRHVDKKYMKAEILKDDSLFDRLYRDGGGIRNQLFHGAEVSLGPSAAGDLSLPEELYAKLVGYFNAKHGTKINTAVLGAPRNPAGNFEAITLWLKPRRGETSFVLREVEDLIQNRQDHADPDGLWRRFESTRPPGGY